MEKTIAVVGYFTIRYNDQIRRYFELGCEVKGMGRGHIQRIKKRVMKSRPQSF